MKDPPEQTEEVSADRAGESGISDAEGQLPSSPLNCRPERPDHAPEREAEQRILAYLSTGSAAWARQPGAQQISQLAASAMLRAVARAPHAVPRGLVIEDTLGRYEVERCLGRGGMGTVYAARDTVLDRQVALKIVHVGGPEAEVQRRRLLREARAAARAAHPNIAAVYDVQEIEGRVVIAMERVPGRTLRAELARAREAHGAAPNRGGLRLDALQSIGIQVADALSHAHASGVVHRDLKPENVMLSPSGDVKILDFGLARMLEPRPGETASLESGSAAGGLRGTPGYIAPEQTRGAPGDARSDLFSLGVLLYELAAGVRPFGGETPEERLISVHVDAPRSFSSLGLRLPTALERIVFRCLEKRPESRPASAAEVAAALRGLSAPTARSPLRGGWPKLAVAPALLGVGLIWGIGHVPSCHPSDEGSSADVGEPAPVARAKVACPVLEATVEDAPAGWLGAAAASLVCLRARAHLGGRSEDVLVPAALLGLPREHKSDFPEDPFQAPDARRRSLSAATSAERFVDGKVTLSNGMFRVRLSLRLADGQAMSEGESEQRHLFVAVQRAMEPLLADARHFTGTDVASEVTAAWGISSVDALVALTDQQLATASGADARRTWRALERHRVAFGDRWTAIDIAHANELEESLSHLSPPDVDRTGPLNFAWSAVARAALDPRANIPSLADEARRLSTAAPDRVSARALRLAEAQLRLRMENPSESYALLGSVAAEDPLGDAYLLHAEAGRSAGGTGVPWAAASWRPEAADVWNVVGLQVGPLDGGAAYLSRARLLGADQPLFAVHFAMFLLVAGDTEGARTVAARLLSQAQPRQQDVGETTSLRNHLAAEYILARVEASEGFPGRAAERARKALFQLQTFGRVRTAEIYLSTFLFDVSLLKETTAVESDAFVSAFIAPEPVRLVPTAEAIVRAAVMCAGASPSVAQRCFDRLRGLIASGFSREPISLRDRQFLEGAEAFSLGDWKAAAEAWRGQSRSPGTRGQHLLPMAFERAGETALSDAMDGRTAQMSGPFAGFGLAHLRFAERAFSRGDFERARPLARRLVQAWETADISIASVSRLRKWLLRSQP